MSSPRPDSGDDFESFAKMYCRTDRCLLPPHMITCTHTPSRPPHAHMITCTHMPLRPPHMITCTHMPSSPPPCTITIISVDVSVLCQKLDCLLFSVLSEMNPFSLLLKRLDFSISGGDTETALGLERAKNCLLAVPKSGASVHSAL